MGLYSFEETLAYFGEKLGGTASAEAIEEKNVDLLLDANHLTLSEGPFEGSLRMELELGIVMTPLSGEQLNELATSNYLGVNTGGCTLSLDCEGKSLKLSAQTTLATPPYENWEWLHRVMHMAREWSETLSCWEGFLLLSRFNKETRDESKNR